MHNILFFIAFLVIGCIPTRHNVEIINAYTFAAPKTVPAIAVFMTIDNRTSEDDRLLDFKIEGINKIELHTTTMNNDIMQMRRVDHYLIPAGQSHNLKPYSDHIMGFELSSDLIAGEIMTGTAIFEKSGQKTISIDIRSRQ